MDVQSISALATAGGTLVLAIATFSAVRSSNRSARVAEESLMAALRPLVVPSLADDPAHKAHWVDGHTALVPGGRAVVEEAGGVIYLAMGLRNVGAGLGLLHAWNLLPPDAVGIEPHADLPAFRRLAIDLYIPSGGTGYWESAVRDAADPARDGLLACLQQRHPIRIDLLYGDQQGGQRMISRFSILPLGDGDWYANVTRHWSVDRPDPR
ncbi:MAG: hypothetical protein ACRDYZ_03845 [Acidimicrobiales bacterium]